MFLFDLPIAILISIVFHLVVKKPLIANLPDYFSGRLQTLRDFNFIHYLKSHIFPFMICLLIGIASHIVWDSFTHANSFFVDQLEFLSTPVNLTGLPTIPVFRYIQHVSTLLGAIAIMIVFHRQPSREVHNTTSTLFWVILFLISIIAFVLRASIGFEYFGDIVTSIISAGLVGLLCANIYTRLRHG
jgi:peptidoglycan/LPS O-acetylase OafA/YrhL